MRKGGLLTLARQSVLIRRQGLTGILLGDSGLEHLPAGLSHSYRQIRRSLRRLLLNFLGDLGGRGNLAT